MNSRWLAVWKAFRITFPLCSLAWIAIIVAKSSQQGFMFSLLMVFYLGVSLPGALIVALFLNRPVGQYMDDHYLVVLTFSFCIYFLLGYGFYWINRRRLQ
jgi:hypothetical protein